MAFSDVLEPSELDPEAVLGFFMDTEGVEREPIVNHLVVLQVFNSFNQLPHHDEPLLHDTFVRSLQRWQEIDDQWPGTLELGFSWLRIRI